MASLKQRLFDEYGGFADKRIKRLEKGTTFAVDDRGPGDVGADGRLLSYFCAIFAEVSQPETLSRESLKVLLNGNVPDGASVRSWVKKQGAQFRAGRQLKFQVAPGEQATLRSLAKAIRAIVAPTAPRSAVPSYKHICPRIAASLERLADVLDKAWANRV